MELTVTPLAGIGEVGPDTDLAAEIAAAAQRADIAFGDGDVVVVTHKVVSKAEGAVVEVVDESAYRELIENEAAQILRRRGDLVIAETRQGFICANAGVDRSNVAEGFAALLPLDPDASAEGLRRALTEATSACVAVIISDTFGRAWRSGVADVAIGVAGMPAILDLRGTTDALGRELSVTEVALADEVAAAADLVMGKDRNIPACVVRGLEFAPGEGTARDLIRNPQDDFFR